MLIKASQFPLLAEFANGTYVRTRNGRREVVRKVAGGSIPPANLRRKNRFKVSARPGRFKLTARVGVGSGYGRVKSIVEKGGNLKNRLNLMAGRRGVLVKGQGSGLGYRGKGMLYVGYRQGGS